MTDWLRARPPPNGARFAQVAADAAFQQTPRHNIRWLEARVESPTVWNATNANFRIWLYDRGTFQMEVCVDEKDVVRAVRHTHRSR